MRGTSAIGRSRKVNRRSSWCGTSSHGTSYGASVRSPPPFRLKRRVPSREQLTGRWSRFAGTGTIEPGEAMIRYVQGDILKAEAEALVNTVNCVGVMGRGIALQFKNVFPANFKSYEAACQR